MNVEFLKQSNNSRLTLLFAGWGMSASDFRFLVKTECIPSLLVCSDYRTLDFDTEILQSYTDVRLIGYSLGVWAASFVFRENKIAFSEKIAINGTMFPINNERGIPTKIYEGTEQQLSEKSLRKFILRMCGTKENFEQFIANTEQKNMAHLKEELRVIQKLSTQYDVSDFQWNKAVISTNDAIFPVENQRKAWQNNKNIVEIDAPHFSPLLFKNL
jgi:biotin synthesis protein BioG